MLAWLKDLQMQQVKTRQLEYSSLQDIQAWSDVPRSQGQSLFHTVLSFNNYNLNRFSAELAPELKIHDLDSFEGSHYPISVLVDPGKKLVLRFNYSCRRFEDGTIAQMLKHLQTLLEAIAANPLNR